MYILMIFSRVTREWHEKFVQKVTCHTHVNVKFTLSCTIWLYSLKFPQKTNHYPLPSYYITSKGRTRALARWLGNYLNLLQTYGNIISDYLRRGCIKKIMTLSSKEHYIPYHPIKKQSSRTPIRIVWLQLLFIPVTTKWLFKDQAPFLNNMCSILICVCIHKYGLSTYIEKAFLHVSLDKSDRESTHCLWLSDHKEPESAFMWTVSGIAILVQWAHHSCCMWHYIIIWPKPFTSIMNHNSGL